MSVVKNTLIVMGTVAAVIFIIITAMGVYGSRSLRNEGYVYNHSDGKYYRPDHPACKIAKCD